MINIDFVEGIFVFGNKNPRRRLSGGACGDFSIWESVTPVWTDLDLMITGIYSIISRFHYFDLFDYFDFADEGDTA